MFVLVVVLALSQVLYALATGLAAQLMGVPVQVVQIGLGPAVTVRRAAPEVRIGLVPGASVSFDAVVGQTILAALPAWLQVLLHLSGPAALLFGAALAGGYAGAWRAVSAVPGELALLLSPLGAAQDALDTLAGLDLSPSAWICAVFARVAAFNLIPLPTLAGGRALLAMLGASERVTMAALKASIIVTLLVLVSICVAVGAWLVGG